MTDANDGRGAKRGLRVLPGKLSVSSEQRRDEQLVLAFMEGDEGAFNDLVRLHERGVLALVRRYAQDPDDARDLAQRAFIKAFELSQPRWYRPKAPASFRAWLYRVAINLGRNHARDLRRWARAPMDEVSALPVSPTGSARLERAEQAALVRAAVLDLPGRHREVLSLRIDAELPFKEIGEVLGITENNAKVHFHYAVKRLREAISEGDEP